MFINQIFVKSVDRAMQASGMPPLLAENFRVSRLRPSVHKSTIRWFGERTMSEVFTAV